jgi:outer membrane protein OmpA-like peptidoglycan-associated protein
VNPVGSADILFDFDRAALRPGAEASLQKIAQFVAARAKHGVLIEGHTDARGSEPYNHKLSLARAEAVHYWLAQRGGLAALDFTTMGLGASRPVAPNMTADGRDDPVGRQKNRRVEITIKK